MSYVHKGGKIITDAEKNESTLLLPWKQKTKGSLKFVVRETIGGDLIGQVLHVFLHLEKENKPSLGVIFSRGSQDLETTQHPPSYYELHCTALH